MDFVSQNRGSICTLHPPSYDGISFQRILTPPRENYACYSPDSVSSISSRGATPEHLSSVGPQAPFCHQQNTLKSVLNGEIPAAYAHLTSSPVCRKSTSPHHYLVTPPHEPTEQTEPMDLSCKSPKPDLADARLTAGNGESSSMLKNLLCAGKRLYEQELTEAPQKSLTGSTKVTLAKKNMFPVSSRVSDWLVKIVQFSKSIPEFSNLSVQDKLTLLLNSWGRLLVLYMSENNFQFAVTPVHVLRDGKDDSATSSQDEPTMKFVEDIQNFIRKCQNMNLDSKEYAFMRMAVLFNSGYLGLERPDIVEQLNSRVQQLLQQHVQVTHANDILHYSRLLMCLPSLFGINCKRIERLFCRHINGNMDMGVLLEELLHKL